MKCLHLSDTHGGKFWRFADLSAVDVVIHTGDLLPNYQPSDRQYEEAMQKVWLTENAAAFNAWIGSKPFIYVPGNHCFAELSSVWKSAIRIGHTPVSILDKVFIGYPEIPAINGFWNFETTKQQLHALAEMVTDSSAEILLTHTPPNGVFSKQWGCDSLSSALFYKNHNIKAHMFGHVHMEKYCQTSLNNIIFSNAAIDDDGIESMCGGIVEV